MHVDNEKDSIQEKAYFVVAFWSWEKQNYFIWLKAYLIKKVTPSNFKIGERYFFN
ncbi:hypothetical protein [Bacillus wiedmannii]|uniref:hypothetical protein n=1 Tax=Bacillus wiedmannii TaxID=1890302 RepID=UPI00159BDF41|nr:hypothetical protein [Bacillus wiedmannii]